MRKKENSSCKFNKEEEPESKFEQDWKESRDVINIQFASGVCIPTILLMEDNGFFIMFAIFICAFLFNFFLQWKIRNNHNRATNRADLFRHFNHAPELNEFVIIKNVLLQGGKRTEREGSIG